MPETIISGLIAGGKATAGPPFGPALGPMGVNIAKIIEEINAKTNQFDGINVPVKVIVDTTTKQFRVEVGMPPTSALILKEIGIKLGAKAKGEIVGNLTLEQAKKVAAAKDTMLHGNSLASKVNQVLGTCKSMGVTCEGQDPREMIKKINSHEIKV